MRCVGDVRALERWSDLKLIRRGMLCGLVFCKGGQGMERRAAAGFCHLSEMMTRRVAMG